jgi:hypothetical protein
MNTNECMAKTPSPEMIIILDRLRLAVSTTGEYSDVISKKLDIFGDFKECNPTGCQDTPIQSGITGELKEVIDVLVNYNYRLQESISVLEKIVG